MKMSDAYAARRLAAAQAAAEIERMNQAPEAPLGIDMILSPVEVPGWQIGFRANGHFVGRAPFPGTRHSMPGKGGGGTSIKGREDEGPPMWLMDGATLDGLRAVIAAGGDYVDVGVEIHQHSPGKCEWTRVYLCEDGLAP